METQKKELELQHTELQKREAQNESDRKKMSEDLEQVYCYLLNCFYAESDFSLIYHLQKLKGTEEYMTFFPCQTIISIKFYTKAENLGDGLIS